MTSTLTYSFDELPLLIESGAEAAPVSGEAEITFWRDGSWSITSIALDSYLRVGNAYTRGRMALEPGSWMYLTIYGRLEGEWKHVVDDAVDEAIEHDREFWAGEAADARRDERKHGEAA